MRIIRPALEEQCIVFEETGSQTPVMQRRYRAWTGCPIDLRAGVVVVLLALSLPEWAEAPSGAISAYNRYVADMEARLAQQHRSGKDFIAEPQRIRRGELVIENLNRTDDAGPPGALLHHWRGTAFVAAATVADFEALMKNFDAYPRHFAPQVVSARILSPHSAVIPDQFTAEIRVRQKHVITVVLDTTYDVTFVRLDAQRGYSISRSTRIDEISSPATEEERVLSVTEEHGLLWRLNTYWTYEEGDGGLYMQVESISLTRAIPAGLGWAIRPYVESVPRESLQFTLRATCQALKDTRPAQGR